MGEFSCFHDVTKFERASSQALDNLSATNARHDAVSTGFSAGIACTHR
jgi:hypothetical protein